MYIYIYVICLSIYIYTHCISLHPISVKSCFSPWHDKFSPLHRPSLVKHLAALGDPIAGAWRIGGGDCNKHGTLDIPHVCIYIYIGDNSTNNID